MLAVNLCVFEGVVKIQAAEEGTSFLVDCNGETIPVYSESSCDIEDGINCRVIGELANDGSCYVKAISVIRLN